MFASEGQPQDEPQHVPDLGALAARATALSADCSLRDLLKGLEQLRTPIDALDIASLTPRQGLAGLFDSRSRRLKAFRNAYRTAAGRTAEHADDLSRGAGALAVRHEALSGLWADLREAVVLFDRQDERRHADRSVSVAAAEMKGAATEPEPTEPLDGEPVAAEPISVRSIALQRLAALRAARNAEHPVPARLLEVRDGVLAWQAEWQDALGLSGSRPRRLRPDVVRLEAARSTLFDRLAKAEAALEAALARKVELAARVPMRPGTP